MHFQYKASPIQCGCFTTPSKLTLTGNRSEISFTRLLFCIDRPQSTPHHFDFNSVPILPLELVCDRVFNLLMAKPNTARLSFYSNLIFFQTLHRIVSLDITSRRCPGAALQPLLMKPIGLTVDKFFFNIKAERIIFPCVNFKFQAAWFRPGKPNMLIELRDYAISICSGHFDKAF